MKKFKSGPKIDFYEEHSSNQINDEKQKLKISHFKIISKKNQRKKKCSIIRPLILLYIIIFIFILYFRNVKIYLKKRVIDKTLENEFPSNITKSQILTWNNEDLNFNEIKREIGIYSKDFLLSYEHMEYLYQRDEPKISVVIPFRNGEKHLRALYASIFNQSLKDIEIIFIDDMSIDKSIEIIEELMKLDKRIVLIRHKDNFGIYNSRNEGIRLAKSKYILMLDAYDLIINNILEKSYITAERYDIDITQFYTIQYNHLIMNILDYKVKTGIIYQPQIKELFYHSKSISLSNKLIKRDLFLKALDFIDKKFKNEQFEFYEDDVIYFGLTKYANSFGFINQLGYFYNNCIHDSVIKKKFDDIIINKTFRSMFTIMKYFLKLSEDNRKEKLMIAYKFFVKKVYLYRSYIKYLDEGFDYINEVLDLYLKSSYILPSEKYFLFDFKNKILNAKNK